MGAWFSQTNLRMNHEHSRNNRAINKKRDERISNKREYKLAKEISSMDLNNIVHYLGSYVHGKKLTRNEKIFVGSLILLTLGAGVSAWYLSQDRQSPVIKSVACNNKVTRGSLQNITIPVNEANPADSISLKLNGTSMDVPKTQDFRNGTVVYSKSFDPSEISNKEGKFIGEVVATDRAGNTAKENVTFYGNLESPKIENLKVERLDLGKYRISAGVTDESLRQINLSLDNGTVIPMAKVNGKYAANVTTSTGLNFTVTAGDAYNLTSSVDGSIAIPLRDTYETSLPEDQYKELKLALFDQSSLFRNIFANDMQDVVANIQNVAIVNGSSMPKNLAYQVLKQIENDQSVTNKFNLAKEVFKIYLDSVSEVQRMSQIYTVNNATKHAGSAEALRNEIGNEIMTQALQKIGESDIDTNFDNAREHMNLLKLAKYISDIIKYPKDWREGAIQVDEIIYKNEFDKVNGDDYVWSKVVKPNVSFIEGQREKGIITASDGEIDLLHANLLDVDIKTGYSLRFAGDINYYTLENRLAMGVKNVTPDETGKSPLEWLFDTSEKHYTDRTKNIDWIDKKWSPYDIAIYKAYGRGDALANNWPNCATQYETNLDKIIAEQGDLVPFIIGEPYFLRGYFPEPIVPNMEGQTIPHYTTLVAYTFGVKSRVAGARYPSGQHWHDEPAFYLNGKWFSFFGNGNYTAFKKDYIDKPATPRLQITGTDGKFIDVDLEN